MRLRSFPFHLLVRLVISLRYLLALSLILVFTACKGPISMLPPPETFFNGKQLELARLVDATDADAVYQFAMGLSLEDLNAYGKEQNSVLVYVALKSTVDAKYLPHVSALIKAGADPQLRENDTDAAYLQAAVGNAHRGKDITLLKAALDAGINPNTVPVHGSTVPMLIQLSHQDGLPAIKLLIESGANVNMRDSGGDTPINRAMMTLGLAEVEYLLDQGADPVQAVNYYGVSFAWLLYDQIRDPANPKDPRLPRAYAIRDRIIKMGVAWPPESPEQFRARYIAQYKQKTGKTFVFMPHEGWEQFFPQYTPAPVRKVPLEQR